jgi:hypothetical protein
VRCDFLMLSPETVDGSIMTSDRLSAVSSI